MQDIDSDLSSFTLLLVSDDGLLGHTESYLADEMSGAEVRTATSTDDLLVRVRDLEVDCAVLDGTMAGGGVDLARRVREDRPGLPLVVLIDDGTGIDRLADFTATATEFLRCGGGIDVDELSFRIASAIATARDAGGERPDRSSDRDDEIEALHGAATDIAACHSETAINEETVAAAAQILDFDMCCTMIHEDGMLRPKAISSESPPEGARPMRTDEGDAGYVFRTGESRITEDTAADDISEPVKSAYRSGMSVPIGEVGVFQAVSTRKGEFSEADVEVAELLLSHTRTALDQIRFEEALGKERDRFRALIEHSSDLITVLEADGTVRYQSQSMEHTLGYDPEKMVGADVFEYIHPEDRDRVRARFQEALGGPDAITVEYRVRDSDDEWRVVESIGTDHLDDPAVEGFVVNSRDVTERKDRLRKLEELPDAACDLRDSVTAEEVAEITVETARSVLEFPIAGAWLHDSDEGILRPAAHTPASESLFGDHPTFSPADRSLSWEVFETGEYRIYDDVRTEERVHNPETAVRSEMIFPLGGHGVVNIGSTERETFTDVDIYFASILAATAESALERLDHERTLQRQQLKLREQNEQLDQFASIVSHDLRNPLSVAKGYLEVAARDGSQESFACIEESLDRMEEITDDILALARAGGEVDALETVDLGAVCEEAWGTVETDEATLVVETARTVCADRTRLRRALENLFRNSIDHGPPDPTVSVSDLAGGFYVEDDGPGIPAAVREQVFETEFTTETDGTGFGLAIVRRIAESHGWSVSTVEGSSGGARFEVTGVEVTDHEPD